MERPDTIVIPAKGYVVVCDGARAIYLHNVGNAETPRLEVVDQTEQSAPPTRDLGAERPGRVVQSHGAARSSVQQTDWHEQAEETFLGTVAKRIEQIVYDGTCSDLVLVAPPKALGLLRKQLTGPASTAISHEVAKDLSGMTVADIQKHLVG